MIASAGDRELDVAAGAINQWARSAAPGVSIFFPEKTPCSTFWLPPLLGKLADFGQVVLSQLLL
jgi:hypothetical protein